MAQIFGTPVLIDDGAYNDLYTAEVAGVAGSQRGVIFFISHYQTAADLFLASLTYGGVSAINILQAQQQRGSGFDNICLEAWVVKQANIPAGSQQIVATAAAGGNNDFKGIAYTIGNWNQTTPIALSDISGSVTSGLCNLVVDPSPNDLALVGWACSDPAWGYDTGENFAAFGITEDRIPSNSATAAHSVHVGYRAAMGHLDSAGAALNITLDSGSVEAAEAQISAILIFPTPGDPPTLTDGPNITGISSTGFDVGGTATQDCQVSYLVVDIGAPASTDAEFDASVDLFNVTAATPFSDHHNG